MKKIMDWFKKTCKVCDGMGIAVCHCNQNNEVVCPNCLGKGSVEKVVVSKQMVEVPCDNPLCTEGLVACSSCKGFGKDENGQPCAQCGGTGQAACPICQGLKRIMRPYQETWTTHEVCHLCGGNQYIACPHCHGTKARVCPTCQGEGLVWNRGKIGLTVVLVLLMAAIPMISITISGFALAGFLLYHAYLRFPPTKEKKPGDDADDYDCDKV